MFLLMQNAETGNLKLLGDKLRRNPKLLCNLTAECLETVKSEGSTVYCSVSSFQIHQNLCAEIVNSKTSYILYWLAIQPIRNVYDILADDFKKTGSCQYLIINDILTSLSGYTLLPKHSPYTEIISRGYASNDFLFNGHI